MRWPRAPASLQGGKRHALGGTFFEPTVLTDVTPQMLVAREETFGPDRAAVPLRDRGRGDPAWPTTPSSVSPPTSTRATSPRSWRVAEALEYGIVGLNTGLISTEVAPFGGVKESGIGREGSKYGILDYTEIKYLCVGLS